MQPNVSKVAKGSSKILEDGGSPAVILLSPLYLGNWGKHG